jgi:hypothetical protein
MALRRVWLSLLALLLAPAAAQAEPATSGDFVLDHPAADPGATAVSAENLRASVSGPGRSRWYGRGSRRASARRSLRTTPAC